MMNGDRTCPSNKPYHDIGSGFNGSCSPGWRRHLGPLGERYQRLVRVVELVWVEESRSGSRSGKHPVNEKDRFLLAFNSSAFIRIS